MLLMGFDCFSNKNMSKGMILTFRRFYFGLLVNSVCLPSFMSLLFMYVFTCSCMCVYRSTWTWRSAVNVRCLLPSLPTLLLWARSLKEPGAWKSLPGQWALGNSLSPPSLCWDDSFMSHMRTFMEVLGIKVMFSCLHASTLPTKAFLSPLKSFLYCHHTGCVDNCHHGPHWAFDHRRHLVSMGKNWGLVGEEQTSKLRP